MKDSFIKVAVASPSLKVADCTYNAAEIVRAAWSAASSGAKLLVTPELGITGYTCGDLFLQQALLGTALEALEKICEETADLDIVLVVGLPIAHHGKLYNCAAVINQNRILGIVPKTHLPNYNEFYELRHFSPAFKDVQLLDTGMLQGIPIGTSLLFRCEEMPQFMLAVEICEDLWVPCPPSIRHASNGATIIANLSASDETIGKTAYRRTLVKSQSARLACGYLYADASGGESSTDLVFAGHNIIAENGYILSETPPFASGMAISELDLACIEHDRRKINTFPAKPSSEYMVLPFTLEVEKTELTRPVARMPFVPDDPQTLADRCEAIFSIQASGIKKRFTHTGSPCAVIGISGGLDSTLALLATVRAFDSMEKSRGNILAVTMPCFGTSERTLQNAKSLCRSLEVTLKTIDITESVRAHFKEIAHKEDQHDVVFENAQARIRTLVLMDLANATGGLVIGTGDLSELALGWATYNGDHMSMYAANSSIPKTLVRHLVEYAAQQHSSLKDTLHDILATPVSPELLPPVDGKISQNTEDLVGPYELHDFFLYYFLRWGFSPSKIFRLAKAAFNGQFTHEVILTWLEVFVRRFFSQQFKRSCLPDGPKVGSVSLSPRGDWRMPSDASASLWLREIDALRSAFRRP